MEDICCKLPVLVSLLYTEYIVCVCMMYIECIVCVYMSGGRCMGSDNLCLVLTAASQAATSGPDLMKRTAHDPGDGILSSMWQVDEALGCPAEGHACVLYLEDL